MLRTSSELVERGKLVWPCCKLDKGGFLSVLCGLGGQVAETAPQGLSYGAHRARSIRTHPAGPRDHVVAGLFKSVGSLASQQAITLWIRRLLAAEMRKVAGCS